MDRSNPYSRNKNIRYKKTLCFVFEKRQILLIVALLILYIVENVTGY